MRAVGDIGPRPLAGNAMADITAEDVNDAIEAYNDAMIASDFQAARIALLRARGLIVGLPDLTGQDGAQIRYGRSDIDKLLDELKDLDSEQEVDGESQWVRTQLIRPGRSQNLSFRG